MNIAEKYINPFTDYGFEEEQAYEESLKSCRDLKNSLDTAREEGFERGIELVLQVFNLRKEGKTTDEIALQVGISPERVTEILRKIQ